jgi:restriction endonuclease S subunit
MNELKPEDAMRALAWYEVVGKKIGSVTIPYDELKAIADLIREKDALIEKHEAYIDNLNDDKACLVEQIEGLRNIIFAIKQQMIGDLEEIWYEGHGFIEYDDLKRWKEQYIKNGQM